MASKTVVADLNRGEKLDGKNYDIWHLLRIAETSEAYQSWRKKDRCAHFTMLSSMHNDLIGEFESYGCSVVIPCKEHLRKMSAMVRELKAAGNNLTDEQQIQAVIHSLPDSWEQMKLNMTHNDSIQMLEDLSRHLELKAERRVAQGQSSAFFARHGQRQAFKAKRKSYEKAPQRGQNGGKPPKRANTTKRPRGKRGGRKQAEQACFNCGVVGHFARDCTEPKKVLFDPFSRTVCYVASSQVLIAYSILDWIVDTGATNHVARDRVGFVEYRRVPARQQMDAYGERVKSGGAWDWHLQTPVASWTHPLTP
uniref:CCHC-type domain-containing protein n=1 Tax=Fagus sylvatica TaxID=28930 RepID=A0A2N9H9T5_FAGSY